MAKFKAVPHQSELSLEGESSLHPIHTATSKLEGHLDVEIGEDGQPDLNNSLTGRLEVAVENLKAGNDLYDLAMQKVLNTRRYPKIVAQLLEVTPLNQDNRYRAEGEVSFHGQSKRFEGELTISQSDDRSLEVNGEQSFDVRDFSIKPPSLLGLKVHPKVKVTLKAVARRED